MRSCSAGAVLRCLALALAPEFALALTAVAGAGSAQARASAALALASSTTRERGLLRQVRRRVAAGAAAEAVSSAASRHGARTKARLATSLHGPKTKDADWFGSFSQGESTYDASADFGLTVDASNPRYQFQAGWSPDIWSDSSAGKVVDEGFFHESMSGGPSVAWQTHYPAVSHRLPGDSTYAGPWVRLRTGNWVQGYTSGLDDRHYGDSGGLFKALGDEKKTGDLSANWFDASVNQYDAFGRAHFPSQLSPRSQVGWQYRSVNGSLNCSTPGCSAQLSLTAYDWRRESAQRCTLSFHVHPTDYDHAYSGENVEWIKVNGATISTKCEPKMSGCTAANASQLFTCVLEMPLEKLMPATGQLNITAKIPQVVDECPFEGNLLAATAAVTCLVAPQDPSPMYGMEPNQPAGQVMESNATYTSLIAPLKCETQGCTAYQKIFLSELGTNYSSCRMTVKVNQTDFDNDFNSEVIEFLSVNGKNVSTGINPGKNPCKLALLGTPLNATEREYVVLQDHDVTAEVAQGEMYVQSKISPFVEECASNGYLLDGSVHIVCDVAAVSSASS
eukprot:TRINITY_DN54893_c0_g1_i1.p1 TRINITY_DN54893_c0_g1~~TRINITY_DN54893_c0_g1_i1.p1  ORF type:complete len:563 (-),score=111.04 TRINITY_DN54893_c0_g1_i1:79-1767(-)